MAKTALDRHIAKSASPLPPMIGLGPNYQPTSVSPINTGTGYVPTQGVPEGIARPQPDNYSLNPQIMGTPTPAQPDYASDLKKAYPGQPESKGSGVQDAISRALIGFSKGMQATPAGGAYNPILAGIAGGLSGTGQQIQEDRQRQEALQAAANAPFVAANAAALSRRAVLVEEKPYKDAEQKAEEEKQLRVAKGKQDILTDAATIDATARNLVNMPPSLWSNVIGRSGGPQRIAIFNRLSELTNKKPMDLETEYQSGLAKAKATGTWQGGKGFATEATADSLEDTLNKMEPLVKKLSPTSLSVLNDAWQRGLAKVSDPDANRVLSHSIAARGLYAQQISGTGSPTDKELAMASEAIRSGLNPEGFAAMKEVALFEGASRAGRLTGKIQHGAPMPGASVGGEIHINPKTGQKIQWNGQAWVTVK